MAGEYYLNFSKSKQLQSAMAKIPDKSESVANKVLRSTGTKSVIQAIIGFMPVSNREKKHAKYSNPLKSDMFNLGFRVYAKGGAAKNKGSFGYLVFPNNGIGPHNFYAQEFFERGGEKASDTIFNSVMTALADTAAEL